MGVKGLWQLLEPVGRPVTLESLENKILGVDASLILNQSIKGMRDRHGNPVPNAHLVGLFNRICKLLYYRIKPVFVFDGGVPHLKKKTLARRKEIRFKAIHGSNIAAERIVKNFLKAKALETVTGKKSSSNIRSRSPREPDVFELSPLPENTNMENQREDEEMDLPLLDQFHNQDLEETFQNPDSIDMNSEDFKALPPEIQHELIKEMKEERKWKFSSNLPKHESNFSQFQLDGVLQRGKMNQRLDELRKEMSQRNSGELAGVASHDSLGNNSTVMSQKILSEETAHYILIKGDEQTKDQSKRETHNDGSVRDFSSEGGFFRKDQDCEIISWTTPRPKQPSETKIPSFDFPDFVSSDSETPSPFLDVPEAGVSPTSPQVKRNLFHFSNAMQTACGREAFAKMENNPRNESHRQKVEEYSRLAPTNRNEAKTDQLRGSELNVICVEDCDRNHEDELLSQIIDKKNELDNLIKKWEESKSLDRTSKGEISIDNRQRISSVHKELAEDTSRSLDRETAGKNIEKQKQLIRSIDETKSVNKADVCSEAFHKIDSAINVIAEKELNFQGVVRVSDSDDDSVEEVQPSTLRGDNEVTKGSGTSDSGRQMEGKLNSAESSAENVKTIRPEAVAEKPAATNANSATNQRNSDCKEDVTSCEEQYSDTKNIFFTEVEKQSDEKQLGTFVEEASGNNSDGDVNKPSKNNEEFQESAKEQTVLVDSESDGQSDENRVDSTDEVAIVVDATTDTIAEDQKVEEDKEKIAVHVDQEAGTSRLPSEWQGASVEDLTEIQCGLESEQNALASEQARQERIAATVSNEMYTECQELLQLFGVPFLVSPMEAEAQCAALDVLNLTEGSITDDSDIFLFGGRRVYKNIFNQNKHAEMYASDSVKSMFALDRPNLICLAFITGSDYTEGIQSVGVVGAMEIIHEFTGEGLEGLKKFKRWHDEVQQQTKLPQETKVKKRLRSVPLPLGFPSDEVYEAYSSPVVDESTESFEWGKPDLHALRLFASEKFGWSSSRTDELLLPVLKQLNREQTQMKINKYFDVKFQEARAVKSKRLRQVLNRKFHPSNSSSNSGNENEKLKSRKAGSKKLRKGRKGKTIGEMERTSSKSEDEEDSCSGENQSESVRLAEVKGTRQKRKAEKSKAEECSFAAVEVGSGRGRGRGGKRSGADKHAVLNLEAKVKLTPVKGFRVLHMASETSLRGASGQEAQAASETASDEIISAKSISESCQTKTIDPVSGARRKRSNSDEQTSQPKRASYVRRRGKGRGFSTKAQAQPGLVDSRKEDDSSSDSSSLSDEDYGNYYDGPKPVSVFHRGRGRGRGSRRGRGR